jgi:hypothetical protein
LVEGVDITPPLDHLEVVESSVCSIRRNPTQQGKAPTTRQDGSSLPRTVGVEHHTSLDNFQLPLQHFLIDIFFLGFLCHPRWHHVPLIIVFITTHFSNREGRCWGGFVRSFIITGVKTISSDPFLVPENVLKLAAE